MSLSHHLAQQQQRLAQLAELLTEEQDALCQAQVDGERLSQLATDKQALLTQLESAETQRSQAQARLGYGPDMAGAEQAARDAGCLPQWHALLDSTRRIAHLNSLNGTLIGQRLQHNQRMLNFLNEARGQSLYGPDGQSHRPGSRLNYKA